MAGPGTYGSPVGAGRLRGDHTTYAVVAAATVLVVALRLPFLRDLPYTDEGGLLVVARHWHSGGPFLYGDVFVDRPPLLLVFFRVCAALGGILPVRAFGLGLVVVAVAAAFWAGSILAGRRGACTAAVVTAALLADTALGSREVNAETVALPLTLLASACFLESVRRSPGVHRRWLVGGGFLAVCALLVKQNLADALLFGLALVIGSALAGGRRRDATSGVRWLVLGAAAPLMATLVWAVTATPGLPTLGYTLYGFRIEGSQTLLAGRTAAEGVRLDLLLRASVVSGLIPLVVASLWLLRRSLVRDPVCVALLVMLGSGVVGVMGGGYYWTHYLLGLVPVTAMLTARAAGAADRPRLLAVLVAATVVASLVSTTSALRSRTPAAETWVGGTAAWMKSLQRPGDSMIVLYGEAALYDATRLRPAYPYIWTLPMRVRDPRLTALRALLSGPRAPTFVLTPSPLDAWNIDPEGHTRQVIDRFYRQVAEVCGSPVYLRRGVDRRVPPSRSGCG